MNFPTIADRLRLNIQSIHQRILTACERSHRDPQTVKLLLATKTVDPPRIAAAFIAGFPILGNNLLVGENKVQEGLGKHEEVAALVGHPLPWHFIGHLQSNKIPEVLRWATVVQSIDQLALAQKLSKRLEFENRDLEIYMQVNTSHEESKFGCEPLHALELARQISELPRLRLMGLMTIGLLGATAEEARPSLRKLRECADEIRQANLNGVHLRELSMGMSGDLEVAIEEGSTLIRVGTAIFGTRNTSDAEYWPPTAPPLP